MLHILFIETFASTQIMFQFEKCVERAQQQKMIQAMAANKTQSDVK